MADPSAPFGGFDPRLLQNVPLFRELAKLMSWQGGPVNWELTTQTATALASPDDEHGGERATAELEQAVRVAELWLDQITALPAVEGPVRAYTRAEWIRSAATTEGLGLYVEPVADGMRAALGKALSAEFGGQEAAAAGPLGATLRSMGAMLYGIQIGTIAGHLAGQLLGTYDLALPTVASRAIGTVGDAAARFAQDYGFDRMEFRFWIALREALYRRLFAGVPWLRGHVAALISTFASEADFNPSRLMEQFGGPGLDPTALSDPSKLSEALAGPDAFTISPTPAQQATLSRLQALVAFVEAYAETVVRAAASGRLSGLERIEEATRRRRATRGPGERFLQQLIGLDLKPSDLRHAQAFCAAVLSARGQAGLDRAFAAPGCLPNERELGDPSAWLVRMAAREIELGIEADPDGFDTDA